MRPQNTLGDSTSFSLGGFCDLFNRGMIVCGVGTTLLFIVGAAGVIFGPALFRMIVHCLGL